MIQQQATSACISGHRPDTNRDSLLILLAGTALFTCAPAPEFINFNARFALFAQEMLRNGPSFFPTVYGAPYPDYPGASTFLIYLASLPFGRVTPFTAALPTAIVSALILVITYRIGAMQSRRWGLAAVLFALFTVGFFAMSRNIALDQYTSLATALSFWLAYSSDCLGRRKRLWLLPLVWTFGFVFRGPLGLVIPAAVSCGYFLWTTRIRPALLVVMAAGGVLILCLAGLVLAARAQGGTPLARQVLNTEMIGRLNDRGAGFTYYWYHSLTSYAVSYPLAILVVVLRFRGIARRRDDNDRFLGALALWALIVLVGMSIPTAKKTRYLLPIVPALSLIASGVMIDVSAHRLLPRAKYILLGICAWLPVVAAAGAAGLLAFAWLRQPEWRRFSFVALALLIPPVLAARKLDRGWKDIRHRDMALLTVGVAAFTVVNVAVAGPISYRLEKTRPFVRQVEALCDKTQGTIAFWQVGPGSEDVKFAVNLSRPRELQFPGDTAALCNWSGVQYVLTKETIFRSLPQHMAGRMRLLARGRIGHRNFVVFTKGTQ